MRLLLLIVTCTLLHEISAISTFYWSQNYKVGDVLPASPYEVHENLYIAKIQIGKQEIPASYEYFSYQAEAEHNGKKITTKNFKILCDPFSDDFYWKNANVSSLTPKLLKEAIVGGSDGKNSFYIGKKYHEGRWKIGRVVLAGVGTSAGLILPTDNGGSYVEKDFEILMYNFDEWQI